MVPFMGNNLEALSKSNSIQFYKKSAGSLFHNSKMPAINRLDGPPAFRQGAFVVEIELPVRCGRFRPYALRVPRIVQKPPSP